MQITIDLDGQPLVFRRSWFTGTASLQVGGVEHKIQSALDPGTHFSFDLVQRWQCQVASHAVVIEKERPRMFAGFRPQTFRILIDGKLVAEQHGY
jgi:hypothetical protein